MLVIKMVNYENNLPPRVQLYLKERKAFHLHILSGLFMPRMRGGLAMSKHLLQSVDNWGVPEATW